MSEGQAGGSYRVSQKQVRTGDELEMKAEEQREDLSAARAYLEAQSELVRSGGYWNCLPAALKLSALLYAEGRSPWLARLRKTKLVSGQVFHVPLIPRGLGGKRAWTTHYVCCCDGMAHDPVAGQPLQLETYSLEVFGEQISLETFIPPAELRAKLVSDGLL